MMFSLMFSKGAALLSLLMLASGPSLADSKMILQQELFGTDVAAFDDSWAGAVAIEGDIAVVGAHGDDINRTTIEPGSVFIFEKDAATGEWTELQQIFAGLADDGDEFGKSLVLEGTLLVVGAPSSEEDDLLRAGSVYIFERTGTNPGDKFQFMMKLISPDGPRASGEFGYSVDISGDTIIIGEPNDPWSDIVAGFAHIYERDGADVWGFGQTLTIPQDFATDLENDEFGTSVAVDGDTAVIGAPGVSLAFVYSRAATLTEWELESTLESTDELTTEFGSSVDIDGDMLVVNTLAYGENLHVFFRDPTDNSWTFDAVLLTGSFDVAISDGFIVGGDVWVRYNETWQEIDGLKFATAVAISGNQVIAGDTSVNAFIYTIPEALWFQTQQLEANAADSNENFGEAMDIDNVNDNMVICDAEHSDGSVGRAYLYERVDGEWSNIQVLTEGPAGEDYEYCLDAAIDGEWLAVVANGGVHMYQLVDGLWVNFQDLQLPLGVGDCFSCSFSFVDLSDDTLILGQYGIISPGAAHIFSNDGTEWSYLQTLESPDGGPDDNFGFLGGVSSDQILVTDDENDSNGDKAGSVYAYARTPDGDWEFEQKIVLETPSPGAEFGSRLAFSNGVAVVAVSGLHRYGENKYVVSKDSTGWGIRSVIQTDGFVLGLSGDATRIATPTVSFTQLSNGTWVEDLSFEDYRPGRAVAVSSSGDAVIIVEHDNTAQVYSLVDILGAEEETSSNVGTGVGASRLGEFP